jgi:uncharacterized membrane protein
MLIGFVMAIFFAANALVRFLSLVPRIFLRSAPVFAVCGLLATVYYAQHTEPRGQGDLIGMAAWYFLVLIVSVVVLLAKRKTKAGC